MARARRKTALLRALHDVRFPGETARHRAARNRVLQAERELRRQVERVAAMRRQLPLGARVPEDYVFEETVGGIAAEHATRTVRLSELFAHGKNSLIVYSFMFGPQMAVACPSCTSILDGLNGQAPHVTERANFVVVARSPIARIREFAARRGWHNLRLLSSSANTYNRDFHAELEDGSQMPILNVFAKRDGDVHHVYASELLYVKPDRGQNPRHVDLLWPLWNMLDLTPEGRGVDWQPRLAYAEPVTLLPRKPIA